MGSCCIICIQQERQRFRFPLCSADVFFLFYDNFHAKRKVFRRKSSAPLPATPFSFFLFFFTLICLYTHTHTRVRCRPFVQTYFAHFCLFAIEAIKEEEKINPTREWKRGDGRACKQRTDCHVRKVAVTSGSGHTAPSVSSSSSPSAQQHSLLTLTYS